MCLTWKNGINVPAPGPLTQTPLGQGQSLSFNDPLRSSHAKLHLKTSDVGYSSPLARLRLLFLPAVCILRFSTNMAEILLNLSTLSRIPWFFYKRIKKPRS